MRKGDAASASPGGSAQARRHPGFGIGGHLGLYRRRTSATGTNNSDNTASSHPSVGRGAGAAAALPPVRTASRPSDTSITPAELGRRPASPAGPPDKVPTALPVDTATQDSGAFATPPPLRDVMAATPTRKLATPATEGKRAPHHLATSPPPTPHQQQPDAALPASGTVSRTESVVNPGAHTSSAVMSSKRHSSRGSKSTSLTTPGSMANPAYDPDPAAASANRLAGAHVGFTLPVEHHEKRHKPISEPPLNATSISGSMRLTRLRAERNTGSTSPSRRPDEQLPATPNGAAEDVVLSDDVTSGTNADVGYDPQASPMTSSFRGRNPSRAPRKRSPATPPSSSPLSVSHKAGHESEGDDSQRTSLRASTQASLAMLQQVAIAEGTTPGSRGHTPPGRRPVSPQISPQMSPQMSRQMSSFQKVASWVAEGGGTSPRLAGKDGDDATADETLIAARPPPIVAQWSASGPTAAQRPQHVPSPTRRHPHGSASKSPRSQLLESIRHLTQALHDYGPIADEPCRTAAAMLGHQLRKSMKEPRVVATVSSGDSTSSSPAAVSHVFVAPSGDDGVDSRSHFSTDDSNSDRLPQGGGSTAAPSERSKGSFYTQGSFKSSNSTGKSAGASACAPMVCELALGSFQLSAHDEPLCTTVDVEAAVMFIDITGYSRLTTQLASKGAFALFDIVNGYLNDIIDVVSVHHGQVAKFAGDAIVVLWYFEELAESVRCATHCAMQLQSKCRSYPVKGTNVTLSTHIGVACGPLQSSVFRSDRVKHMQNHFHMISGRAMRQAAEAVDAAKAGEVCLTRKAAQLACSGSHFAERQQHLLELTHMEAYCTCDLRWGHRHFLGADFVEDVENRRDNLKRFVPPTIAEQLKRGKLKSAMAEMRVLTVLFIHKSDETIDLADWFDEVQRVIDEHRCTILQIIDDDKGVHVVAAVNLFTTDRELAVTGIQIAKSLLERQAGCTIGVATGVTFCGVVGNDAAARYDITGWACVRACRLMQHGVAHNMPVVIGDSVVTYSGDASMTVPIGEAIIKGHPDPVKIYGIATVPTRVLSAICSSTVPCKQVHAAQYDHIIEHVIVPKAQRAAVLVRGNSNTGKALLLVRTLYDNAINSIMHDAVEDSRPLDVVWTLANWFIHHRDNDLSSRAEAIRTALERSHNILSTRLALELLSLTISKGHSTAIVIRQAQRLDSASLSFLRQTMLGASKGTGRWINMLTVVPQNGLLPWSAIASMLGPKTTTVHLPAHISQAECTALVEHAFGWDCDAALRATIEEQSGRIPGCVDHMIHYIQSLNPPVTFVRADGVIAAEAGAVRDIRKRSWPQISQAACAKSSHFVAALSLRGSTALKVAAILSTPYTALPKALVLHALCKAIPEIKVRHLAKDVELLIDLGLLERFEDDGYGGGTSHKNATVATNANNKAVHHASGSDEYIRFSSPATLDVVRASLLPAEVKACGQSALQKFNALFDIVTPAEFFTLGIYHFLAGDRGQMEEHLRAGWSLLIEDGGEPPDDEIVNAPPRLREIDPLRAALLADMHRLGIDAADSVPSLASALAKESGTAKRGLEPIDYDDDDDDDTATAVPRIAAPKRLIDRDEHSDGSDGSDRSDDDDDDAGQASPTSKGPLGMLSVPRLTSGVAAPTEKSRSTLRAERSEALEQSLQQAKRELGLNVSPGKGIVTLQAPQAAGTDGSLTPFEATDAEAGMRLALHIVELRTWKPPIALGALNFPLRMEAVLLAKIAVHAHRKTAVSETELGTQKKRLEMFCVARQQIDRVVGFEPALPDEERHLLAWIKPRPTVREASSNAVRFWEYVRSTVNPRVERIFEHIRSRAMYVPYPPSYKPLFHGWEREGMEAALRKTIATWDGCNTSALRDGLMELATHGWIPKNPEQTLEYQRDVYLRKRREPAFAFVALLYVNLHLSQV